MMSTKAAILLIVIFLHQILCENPTITINNGKVMGISNTTIEKNTTYYAFRGIPYAKPPTGSLRFKAPQKPDSWKDTLDGTEDGVECLQTLDNRSIVGSEDCLFINVYTSKLTVNRGLAVMVWIHGGTFKSGSGKYENFRPDYILEEGIVYVSFNYRLGVFGWFSTEDVQSPGNYGMKDQILALKWVQENIAHFGGDPRKVTIFGESAGAASVSYLVQSNLTQGLFTAAIMLSGTSLNQWAYQFKARKHAFELGDDLGINSTDSETLVKNLMEQDAKAIITAQEIVHYTNFLKNALPGVPWGPVSEPLSRESAFSGHSHKHLSDGSFKRVPMILGFSSNEMEVMLQYLMVSGLALENYDMDHSKLAPFDINDNNPYKRFFAGNAIKRKYFGESSVASQPEKVVLFGNIDRFLRPIREFVRLASIHTDVYYYRFAHVGDLGGDVGSRSYWGVAHGEILNYLFVTDHNSTKNDDVVRKRMVKMLTNFAKLGVPHYPTSDPLFANSVTPRWVPARMNESNIPVNSRLHYLKITSSLLMASNPNQTDWEFYKNRIYGVYGDGDYTTY